jgi:hypothetical protein
MSGAMSGSNNWGLLFYTGGMAMLGPEDFPAEYFSALIWIEPHDGVNVEHWPAEFGIVSGYATTGEVWPEARNRDADRRLEQRLRAKNVWLRRVDITSPDRSHREPSWAVALPWEPLCDLGRRFLQTAIYYVQADQLYVSFCDQRRQLVEVGSFRERLRIAC